MAPVHPDMGIEEFMAEDTTAQAPDTGAEGAEDQAAQQALADAAQNGADGDAKSPAETDWQAQAEKWKAQARKHEKTAKENSDAARRLKEFEDSQKSESQRLQDQLAERELELQQLRLERVRSTAAAQAGLPAELVDTITAVDPDEALAQAQKIVAYVNSRTAEAQPTPATPDFRQGTRPGTPKSASPDDWLRGAVLRGR